jgi:hypothetical protein
MKKDFMSRFEWEVEEFKKMFGFQPISFTQHGMGQQFKETRSKFNSSIALAKQLTGIQVTDCAGYDIQYMYKVTDANWCQKRQSRFITNHFTSYPFIPFANGEVFGIITHPTYWTK